MLSGAIQTPSGRYKYLEGHGCPYARPDGVIWWYSLALDVTDRVEATKQVRQALEKASDESRAKSAFLSHMGHEIRTPLNAIIGYGQMLEMGVGFPSEKPPERVRQYLNSILTSSRHLNNLIEQLFDLSLIESKSLNLSEDWFELSPVLREAAEICSTPECVLQLRINEIKGFGGISLFADRQRLLQVFINIFRNTQKYAKSSQSEISTTQANDLFIITMEDKGPGFPEDVLDRFGEPFLQARSTEDNAGSGLGLGLYISRQIIASHGWELNAENSEEGGARMNILLPSSMVSISK